jgi:ankyrin repeat protein
VSEKKENKAEETADAAGAPDRQLPAEILKRLEESRSHNPSKLWLFLLVALCVAAVVGSKRMLKRQNTARLFDSRVLADPERMDGMLEYGAEVNGEIDGDTPLIAASRGGNAGSVRALLGRGAWVNPDTVTRIPLHAASANGHEDVATLLLDAGAKLEATDPLGRSALGVAAGAGEPGMVKLLLARGAVVEAAEANAAPMILAVQGLIAQLPKRKDVPEETPLAEQPPREVDAELLGRYEAVLRELSGAGADVNAVGGMGETPLLLAVEADLPQMAELLLALGADLAKATEFGSPLLYAVKSRRWEVARKLVPSGPGSPLREALGMDVLRETVMANNREFMAYLIANGAGTGELPDWFEGDSTSAKGTELVITELYRRFTKEMIAMMGDPFDDPESPVGRAFFRNRLSLNGISEYATVGERSRSAIEGARLLTITCWVRPRALGSERAEGQYLVSRHRRGVDTGFELYLDGKKRPVWVIYNGVKPFKVQGERPLEDGEWTHLAATSGLGRLTLFVNGKQVAEASAPSVLCENSGYLHVGRRASAELGYFAGEMQFLAVYLDRLFEGRFESTIHPVKPKEAYVLLRAEGKRLTDQAGHAITRFPEP